MANNKMTDLQNHLFQAIEMLHSGELKVDAAMAISKLGSTLLESAKVEIKYMETVGASRATSPLLASVDEKATPAPALPPARITYRCSTAECGWEGTQLQKQLVANDGLRERVCPQCKKDHFTVLVNGQDQ